MKKAVYAGTFGILTNGHLDVIQTAAQLFDELVVAIGVNPEKNPIFSPEERRDVIHEVLAQRIAEEITNPKITIDDRHLDFVSVDIFNNEFLVDYVKRIGANYIVRGLRDIEDFRQEQYYRHFNKAAAPEIETVYLMTNHQAISSSAIQKMIGPKGWVKFVEPYVPSPVLNRLILKYPEENL